MRFHFEIPENTDAVIRLPKQGKQNHISINGKTIKTDDAGRFIEFRVKSGKWSGSVDEIGVNP